VPFIGSAIAGLMACSPALDWREIRISAADIRMAFPCKPEVAQHEATAAGPAMGLAVCTAAGQRFSLAWADVQDPRLLEPAVKQMRDTLAAKLGHGTPSERPGGMNLRGATPMAGSGVYELQGAPQQARWAVFARGLRVYRVLQQGDRIDDAAWSSFLDSVSFAP